jgi:hypothetical protein
MCATWERNSGANACLITEPEHLIQGVATLPKDNPVVEVEARIVGWMERDDEIAADSAAAFFEERRFTEYVRYRPRLCKNPRSARFQGSLYHSRPRENAVAAVLRGQGLVPRLPVCVFTQPRPIADLQLILALQPAQRERPDLDFIFCSAKEPVRNRLKVHVFYNDRNIIASPSTGRSKAAWFKTDDL